MITTKQRDTFLIRHIVSGYLGCHRSTVLVGPQIEQVVCIYQLLGKYWQLKPHRHMNQAATLHRHLDLIRCLRPPYLFYSLERLSENLREKGYAAVSERTVERDMNELRNEYGLTIPYHRTRKGYYLELPTEQDVSDFNEFVQLLERRERLEFLSSAVTSPRDVSRYLQLEQNDQFTGAHHLALLWEALRSGRTVKFTYAPYTRAEVRLRTVEPGLIFEYRNRWYFDGWDVAVDQMRTFGLDRIQNLELTNQPIRTQRSEHYRSYRQHAIGVTCQPDRQPERVVLRFSATEYQYIQSLPLHPSQREVGRDERGVEVELFVVINHELEREILAYGEEVEVVGPESLRSRLRERVGKMRALY